MGHSLVIYSCDADKPQPGHRADGRYVVQLHTAAQIVRAVAVVQNRKNRAADIVHGDILHQNIGNAPALGAFQLDSLAPDIAHRAVGDNYAGNLADGL